VLICSCLAPALIVRYYYSLPYWERVEEEHQKLAAAEAQLHKAVAVAPQAAQPVNQVWGMAGIVMADTELQHATATMLNPAAFVDNMQLG
jgi:hypothetical protein